MKTNCNADISGSTNHRKKKKKKKKTITFPPKIRFRKTNKN
jgi:hypothetical protein